MMITYDIDKSKQLTEKVSIGPKIVVPEQHSYVKFSDKSNSHFLIKMKDM